ncbi:MAG: DNA repair protein RecN [Gammaproteobacteria bacterium]|nr:DNA repair protein RecN [Gammaproteobacteria bacterium]MDH4314564.1 DNA repair protein RecN [Gammaproteobacteria bacterium]MDH5213751.1 DNA repair protein RecN [Gammaproteobacteria bacterium]MDH5499614.1 DNA repair protein RecN [Gammaproteobacteria bacterium]
MLTRLQIRNFAIIDQATVEFDAGMTVLTGETGAGKSILVDALGLVLGERGSTGLVRPGSDRAEFSAEFDISQHDTARAWLASQALDNDDDCLLRRVVGADGRSRAFVNGNAVTLQNLKTLGEILLDIHGQHFHQSLVRRNVQRDLLDHFGGLSDLRSTTRNAFEDWQKLSREWQDLENANSDRASRIELLGFQAAELESLGLKAGEYADLQTERRTLQNSGRLAEAVNVAIGVIYDGEPANAQNLVAEATHAIENASNYDERLKPALTLLNDAGIQISEAYDLLRRYAESLDADPLRRDQVEERLDAIQAVARKHRCEPEELQEVHERVRDQLDTLETAEERGVELKQMAKRAETTYRDAATALSKQRQQASKKFSTAVSVAMADLGMSGGVFEVQLSNSAEARASGIDDIEYLISANPGQAPMPLSKIASGGELSRMSLAIQVIASDGSTIPTMIFDEVDSGVGGGVAEMVGRHLRGLGRNRQVLCVTHLAQVAGMADQHFRVVKMSDGKSTRISINRLNRDERIEELARMLGGVKITKKTREHAAEMLDNSRRSEGISSKSSKTG